MSLLYEITFSLCTTLAATGIFSLLVSGRQMEKVMRFLLSLFLLNSLLFPFVNGELEDLSFPKQETDNFYGEALEQQWEEQFLSLTEIQIAHEVENILILQGISPEKVEVEIHIGAENNITINKCMVYLSGEETFSQGDLSYELQKEVGVKPEFIVE